MSRIGTRRQMIRSAFHGMQSLEARRLLAAVSWDGGGGNLLWNNPANWSNDVLPTAADDVTIDVPAAITVAVSSGSHSINSLTCAEGLTINSTGSLSIASASTISGLLTLGGSGQLTGAGAIAVNGNATISGGTLSGTGLLSLSAGSTTTVTGGNTAVTKNIRNDGTFNMSSGGDLTFGGATFTNDGTLNFTGSGADFGFSLGANTLVNNGTLTKSGTTTSTIRFQVTNNGTITQTAGTLALNPTGGGTALANNGAMTVASGATLQVGSLVSGATSTLGGAGTVNFITGGTSTLEPGRFATTSDLVFSGGTVIVNVARTQTANTTLSGNVTFNQPVAFNGTVAVPGTAAFNGTAAFAGTLGVAGTATFSSTGTFGGNVSVTGRLDVNTIGSGLSIPTVAVSSGTLGGTGLLVVTTTLTSNGNMTMDGAGTTRLAAGATLPNVGNAWGINLGHTFHNQGTVTMGGDNPDIYLSDGTFLNDGILQSVNGTGLDTITNSPGTNLFINNGTILKTVGVASSVFSIEVPTQHNGLVHVGPGAVAFAGTTNVYNPGSATAGVGDIRFNAGTHTFLSPTTLTGIGAAGGFPVFNGGTAIFNVDTTIINGRFGGSTIEGPATLSLGNGTQVYGGHFSQAGGGGLRVPVGATAQLTGNNPVFGRPFDIFGTFQMSSGGDMNVLNTVVTVENTGVLHFNTTAGGSDIEYAPGAASGMVLNRGTVLRDVGGSATIRVRFDNQGLVDCNGGTLSISGGFADGTFTRTTGVYDVNHSTLNFGAAVNTNGAEVIARAGASIGGFTNLQYNDGKLDLRDGIDWTFDPFAAQGNTMYNRGQIELSPGSVFTLAPGNHLVFAGTGNATLRSEIAGPTDAEYGRLVVGGQLRLASLDGGRSQLDPDLVGGYDPAAGTRFNIVTANTLVETFDDYFGATTPSGNLLLAGKTATQYYAEVGAGTPPAAPQILSSGFEYQTRQAIVLGFNVDVSAFVSRKDLALVNLTTNTPVNRDLGTLIYDAGALTATLTLTNLLADGNYRLTIAADDIANAAGQTLTSPLTLDFFVLAGDANRDRAVGFDDLLIIAQNYGLTGRNFSQGNVNYTANGAVNFDDLLVIAQQYGKTLAAPTLIGTTTTRTASRVKSQLPELV